MENICVIMLHCDSNPKTLEGEIRELYTPELEICYVRISDRFNPLQRVFILRKIRKVFTKIEINVKPVSDYSINLLNTFINYHQNLASDIAQQLNIFGKVLYRVWQRWKSKDEKII